jgi:conjugal transfer pilus assembly protein TraF
VAFANASELVWQKYPELSVAKDAPLAAPGRNALTREMVAERDRLLARSREDFALLFFTSASCPFCAEQEAILAYLRERFGWTVKPIAVEREPALAESFAIQTTPSLLLIRRGSRDFLPVTAGVASASEIEARLYRGIRLLLGDVTPENFNLYDFQKGGGFDVESGR